MNTRALFAATTLLALASCTTRAAQQSSVVEADAMVTETVADMIPTGPATDLHRFILSAHELNLSPGLAVVVVQGNEVVYSADFGFADRQGDRKVDPESIFYIASSTKSFTGMAAAKLASDGRLDLDAPLSAYLPDLQMTPPLSEDSITLRQLLTHTHGINNGGPIVLRTAFTGEHTPEMLLDLLAKQPAGAQGHNFEYGNMGYNVASMAMDAALGESWKDVLAEEIFAPLGMKSTTAYRSSVDESRLAMPYGWEPDGWERKRYAKDDSNMHAAGGMMTTTTDLARWLIVNMNEGRIDGRQVLPAAVIAEAHKAVADNDDSWGPFSRDGYGLGWHVGVFDGSKQIRHFGGFTGFHTHVSFMPDEKIGVVVLVNDSQLGAVLATSVASVAYDAFRGVEDLDAKSGEYLTVLSERAEDRRNRIRADRERRAARPQELPRPLEAYAGVYESSGLGRMTWSIRDGRLHAAIGLAQSVVEVFNGAEDKLRVELTGSGMVVSFEFPQGADLATALTVAGERFERI